MTAYMAEAPHGAEVLERFQVLEAGGDSRIQLVQKLVGVLTYAMQILGLAIIMLVVFW